MKDDTDPFHVTRPGVRRAASTNKPDSSRLDATLQHALSDSRSKSFPRTHREDSIGFGKEQGRRTNELGVSTHRGNSTDHGTGPSGTQSDSPLPPNLEEGTHTTASDISERSPSRLEAALDQQHRRTSHMHEVPWNTHASSSKVASSDDGQAENSSTDAQRSADQGQVERADTVLAGETVVPLPTPTAADAVISAAVDQGHKSSQDIAQAQAAATESHTAMRADSVSEAAGTISHRKLAANETLGASDLEQQPSHSASSSSSYSKHNSTVVWLAAGISACTAAAGGLWFWFKRRNPQPAPAAAAEDDEFTRALKEMEAEERAFEKEAAADNDAGAELSAEEAALAMQQADAARKQRMIDAALADGDAELAKIDAMDSADLDNLDPDELAALEAELAELEGDGEEGYLTVNVTDSQSAAPTVN